MNLQLVALLKAHIGKRLTSDLATRIYMLAETMPMLIPPDRIEAILPETCGQVTFAIERMRDIEAEIKPLHQAHWHETEGHRHGLDLNPDYETFKRYERTGRYVLFTARKAGCLVGNCAMYLGMSAHTQTLVATEDTLYLLPEARRGTTGRAFIGYVEDGLRKLGVREIDITVKTVNRAERLFRMLGYRHVENGLTKILEAENVQQETAEA